MRPYLQPLLCYLALCFNVLPTLAVKIPFQGRHIAPYDSANTLSRRASVLGNTSVAVTNSHNAQYYSNITLGGQTVTVLLDTGSSDLWVNFPSTPPATTDTGKSVTLSYAVGEAAGDIVTTELQFDNYTVSEQAFLLVTNTSSFSSDIHAQGYSGLVGLGPNAGSVIYEKIDDNSGQSMLDNIFSQDLTTSNFISILLDRTGDPTASFTGQITISEYVTEFENISSTTKIPIDELHKIIDSDQHWQILTDANKGIVGPDGNVIQYDSIVPSAPDGQLVAVIDSGFTFSQVPRDVSDAIYGRVRNAVYDTTNQYWTIPCGQLLNISFNFGGTNFPIHPLDTVDSDFDITNAEGDTVCIGSFQPITTAFSLLGNYDMILGMNFLRNAYALFDFGDWVDDSSNDRGDPFVQLLPLTNVAAASTDFYNVRINGTSNANTDFSLLPASEEQHSPVSAEEKKQEYQEMILSRWPYILVGCLAFVILCVGLCVWRFCCRNKRRRGTTGIFGIGGKKQTNENTSYLPLQAHGSVASLPAYTAQRT